MNDSKIHSFLGLNHWLVPVAVAVLLVLGSLFSGRGSDITSRESARLGRRIDRRLDKLEAYMAETMAQNHAEWPTLKDFPSDMVIYRYVDDTLQSWVNEFTTGNDDIRHGIYIQRFSDLGYGQTSQLSDADTSYRFMNMGSEWYLVRSMEDPSGCKVIGGLDVKSAQAGGTNGVNRRLKLSDRFSLYEISETGGAAVSVRGRPMLRLIQENVRALPLIPNEYLLWIAVFLMLTGIFMYTHRHKTLRSLAVAEIAQTLFLGVFFLISKAFQSSYTLFSPTLFAGGSFLSSLGSVLIINLWIAVGVMLVYMLRRELLRSTYGSDKGETWKGICTASFVLAFVLICVYGHTSFRSIIENSNITLELYKVSGLSVYTLCVYISYSLLLLSLLLLLQLLSPIIRHGTGIRYSMLRRPERFLFAAIGTVYFVATTSVLGFDREARRAEMLANRLSMDRDLSFELTLRGAEGSIATDPVISHILSTDLDYRVVFNRITEDYLARFSNGYSLNMYVFRGNEADGRIRDELRKRVSEGERISPDSRFLYSRSASGRAQYTGIFSYNESTGPVNLLLSLESKAGAAKRGYEAIVGASSVEDIFTRAAYSHARYLGARLVSYEGDYAYPTTLSGDMLEFYGTFREAGHYRDESYIHFVRHISDNEYIIVSRPKRPFTRYMVASFMTYLLVFFILSIPAMLLRRRGPFEKNYFRQRINTVLYVSLVGTLVIMALVSVLFVYDRNEANVRDLMIGKIGTIQSFIASRARFYDSYQNMTTQDFEDFLENAGTYTNSDITLYTPSGVVFRSTYPDIFEKLTVSRRLDYRAFRNINFRYRRYYIHRDEISGHKYYAMFAPVMNDSGKMIAILSAPYTDEGMGFRDEAVFHAFFIISVFLLLLLFTRYFTSAVVDKMFRPLVEMGRRMTSARKEGLEYIYYDREDEISTLVLAYNKMVHGLAESSKQSAEIERDKAWSQMARQVAHEIKNPLTPIRLQIQRIIRLKEKHAPDWEQKFDSIAPVILESIEVLTDTANEFSTFAKLYTEDSVEINLDEMASGQIALFSDKDNVTFQYFGLRDAVISGPKPQLTRVFVNLLTNSVQAIENMQKDSREKGEEPVHGYVTLSIRKSMKDGFYDIVVEDNGPGVKDEDRVHLFTPNFTTKTSGSGLGLAICKNILERCGGEISYSKSFALGGACFTVRYPMPPKNTK